MVVRCRNAFYVSLFCGKGAKQHMDRYRIEIDIKGWGLDQALNCEEHAKDLMMRIMTRNKKG